MKVTNSTNLYLQSSVGLHGLLYIWKRQENNISYNIYIKHQQSFIFKMAKKNVIAWWYSKVPQLWLLQIYICFPCSSYKKIVSM